MVTNMKGIYFHIDAVLEVLENKAVLRSGLETTNKVASVNFFESDVASGCVREPAASVFIPQRIVFEEASTS